MQTPPTGTVTFLFTDIEGSTRLLDQLGDSVYAEVLVLHQEIIRRAVRVMGGHEVDTQGDAFFVVFPDARAAVETAVAAQQALAIQVWPEGIALRVRMGLHTGRPIIVGARHIGKDVHQAARIAAAAHGGQVLLSGQTRESLGEALPGGLSLRDLGERRLKDLRRPQRLFQLLIPGLIAEFPPIKTLDARPNNLPVQPTSLIGRAKEITTLETLLRRRDIRLVTLTGPGGSGKTRLALQVGADLIDEFEHGVFFVNLAPISDPGAVIGTIAHTLGLRETGEAPLVEALTGFIENRQLLLILDNFEQVVTAGPELSRLLTRTPHLKVIVTSRSTLHLSGENEFPVPPLKLPVGTGEDLETLARAEAVALFVDRAVAVRPGFTLTPSEAPIIAQICRRLDGLPLAIELAAGRSKVLPPEALLARLDRRLTLLTGGPRDLPERQQTLRATIDWSVRLLSPVEQRLFRRVSIFTGGASLDAIDTVCNGDLGISMLDGLTSLVNNSFLRQEESTGNEPRFWMLETVREFALEQLDLSGETHMLRRRHRDHYLRLAEAAGPELSGGDQEPWLRRLEAEHDNLRSACEWSITIEKDPVTGMRLTGSLWRFWFMRGHLSEGRRWLEAALAIDLDGKSLALSKTLYGAGVLAWSQGNYHRAKELHERNLALCRDLDDEEGTAVALADLGILAKHQGDLARAKHLQEESLHMFRRLDNKAGMADALNSLGGLAFEHGAHADAESLLGESLALRRDLRDQWGIALVLHNLGDVALARHSLERAKTLQTESLRLRSALGDQIGIVLCLEALATIGTRQGETMWAVRLLAAAAQLRENLRFPLDRFNKVEHDRTLLALTQNLDPAAFAALWSEGQTMRPNEAIEFALAGGLPE